MDSVSALLITTDERVIATSQRLARESGTRLSVAGSLREASKAMARQQFDLLLVQADSPDEQLRRRLGDGLVFADRPPVVALSRTGSIREAVRCLQAGARDYLWPRPDDGGKLDSVLRDALGGLAEGGNQRPEPLTRLPALPGFLSLDQQTLSVCETAVRAVAMGRPLVICGPSGAGKTLLARKVHQFSPRCLGPLVEVYCGPTGRARQEADLFGVEGRRPGAVERADGTTLLLEAADYLVPRVAARLARAMQGKVAGPDGAPSADMQFIGTAEGPADDSAAEGLLGLLEAAVRVRLSPLRERRVDIPLLADHFLGLAAARYKRSIERITRPAMDALAHYEWPGNARELRNAVEYAVMLTRGPAIQRASLPPRVRARSAPGAGNNGDVKPLKAALQGPERRYILRALEDSGWNKTSAAKRLKISRSTLYKKMRRHGLNGEPSGRRTA
ncbi:MAG: helix-turn-helix domain-containing protein [Candidatus Brocadiia bacterium]